MQLYKEKMPQIAIEIEKTSKSSDFHRFYDIFVNFLIHLLA